MKITKKFTHYWFVFISIVSFLIGWGMLAHSLKPIQTSQSTNTTLQQLPPIQAFGTGNGSSSSGLNLISPAPQVSSGFGMLRTGGS
jgi:hypothetical protein